MLNFAKSFQKVNNPRTSTLRFYSEIHRPQKRLSGIVKYTEGEGADEWLTIEEETTKNYYYWVVWPFDYFGIYGKPLEIGEKVTFIEDTQAPAKWRAKSLIVEKTGKPPGIAGQELTH